MNERGAIEKAAWLIDRGYSEMELFELATKILSQSRDQMVDKSSEDINIIDNNNVIDEELLCSNKINSTNGISQS